MDDYTLQQELEALAGNAFNPYHDGDDRKQTEPVSTTISRWTTLFNLSDNEAVDRIMKHRNNLTRIRITDEHWDTIKADKEPEDYDREAYEYELELQKKKAALPDLVPSASDGSLTYLVELRGPLGSPEKVKSAANMAELPTVVGGRSVEEGRHVWLCCIDEAGKRAILLWAAHEAVGFEPTILVNPKSLQ